MAPASAAASAGRKSPATVLLLYVACAFILLLLLAYYSPRLQPHAHGRSLHRRLKLHPKSAPSSGAASGGNVGQQQTQHQNHHAASFDPTIAELERRLDDKEWEREHYSLLHGGEPDDHMKEWEEFLKDEEDFINDDERFNVADRIRELFPKIDVAPQDGFVSLDELTTWNLQQARADQHHRSAREMELYNKDGDGIVSFEAFNKLRQESHGEGNMLGFQWWKEEHFNASDANADGLLDKAEFNDFLNPSDSDNPKIINLLCRQEIRMESNPSISPPSVNNENYDPKVDKARKANSNDPGWKYGYWANLQKPDKVTCTLCDTEVSGGIKRLKQHLAGGYGDAKMCPKTTTAIRKEMRDYLESNKRRRPLFNEEDDEPPEEPADVVVVDAVAAPAARAESVQAEDSAPAESQASKVQPSSGTAAKQRRANYLFKATAASNTKAKPKVNKSIVEMLRKTPEELVDERRKGCSQPTIPAKIRTKEEKHYVDQQWALWFYECGVPFNAAAARQFEIAVEATAQFGSCYKPPTPYMLGEPLLKDAVKLTSSMREEHEQAWKMYGCTLMSDGWTDKRGRHLINFLVNSPAGTYFLESVDASSEVHDAFMLADLLEAKIEEIGEDKVVQVITDNGANYKAAGRILMERISTLYWSPCAAHCLDLMLEEIGNLKEFKKPIARAKRVTTFIYRHGRILSLMREKTGADLVRPAATRFATSFLTLKSLHKHRDALKALFVSEEWLGNKLAKTAAGQEVHNTVLSMEFWNSVEDCLRASAPLLIVLRVVDGDERPAMPEVAALMNHAKEKIKLSFATENKKTLLKNIIKIIEKRWVTQMDHPLYGAALYLNPGRLHSLIQADDDATVGQLRGCFLDVLGRMVEDEEIRSKIDAQSLDYEGLRGDAFSNKMAKQNLQNLNPLDWWRSYGGRAIELQRFARRIVSLCASSSGCERNWSTFEFTHTKKRNRLLHKRLNDIVFVSYNRKMKTRFQLRREKKGKNFDPLVIEEFDWDNEWADSSYVHPQGARGCDNGDNGNGLTWELVDEAVGASSSLRGRNFPRNASSKRARNGQSRLAELEEDLDLANEEEEEEDPHDDADVSDCEQDPNGSNGGGENMEGPNILDEFDDGY